MTLYLPKIPQALCPSANHGSGQLRSLLHRLDSLNKKEERQRKFYTPMLNAEQNTIETCDEKLSSWDFTSRHRYADVLYADQFNNLELERMDALRTQRQELLKLGVSPTHIKVPRKRRQRQGQPEVKERLKNIKSRFQQDPKSLNSMRHDPHRGWTKQLDTVSRRYYYFHLFTGQTTWEPPPEFPEEYQMLIEMRERDKESKEFDMAADRPGSNSESAPAKRRKSSDAHKPFRRSSIPGSKAPKSPDPITTVRRKSESKAAPPHLDLELDSKDDDTVVDSLGVGRSISSPPAQTLASPMRRGSTKLIKQGSVRTMKRQPSKAILHRRPGPDKAATTMQCGIRNWIARKTMAAKFKCVDAWERFVHKYPHAYHMRIANLSKATVADLVRSSLSEQKDLEVLTGQLHRLIVNLSKGPAGTSDDLRLSLDSAQGKPGKHGPAKGDKGKRDKDSTRKRNKA